MVPDGHCTYQKRALKCATPLAIHRVFTTPEIRHCARRVCINARLFSLHCTPRRAQGVLFYRRQQNGRIIVSTCFKTCLLSLIEKSLPRQQCGFPSLIMLIYHLSIRSVQRLFQGMVYSDTFCNCQRQ